MRSFEPVTVHVRDLTARLARSAIDAELRGTVARRDGRVVDRRRVEGTASTAGGPGTTPWLRLARQTSPFTSIVDRLRYPGDREILDRVLPWARPVVGLRDADPLQRALTLDVPQVRALGEFVDPVRGRTGRCRR
jgi:hypothetical protein